MKEVALFLFGIVLGACITTASLSITAERTETVFVYGTLTNPLVRSVACLCFVTSEPSTLEGYRKVGRNVVPDEGSLVRGKLITVSLAELWRLDRYEGTPDYYKRVFVANHPRQPWVYVKPLN